MIWNFLMNLQIVLLNALQEPIPRQIYDYILRSQHIQKLFDNLQDRQLLRNICRSGHRPNYRSLEDNLAQVCETRCVKEIKSPPDVLVVFLTASEV